MGALRFRVKSRLAVFCMLGVLAWAGALRAASASWAPSHIVIVIEENHSFGQIIGNANAPFINRLAKEGALFTDAHGVRHPSQPNYLALFSGSTQGVTNDNAVPGTPLSTPNLAAGLLGKGLGFAGYSEDLPSVGSTVPWAKGVYARKHNPWSNWQSATPKNNQLLPTTNQPFTNFPTDFEQLSTVAFVIPNIDNDQHGRDHTPSEALIRRSDDWLQRNIEPYVKWAVANDSLLILTWDEDNDTKANRIPLIMVGAKIKAGEYGQRVDHYNVLRMIAEFYGLGMIGSSGSAPSVGGVFAD